MQPADKVNPMDIFSAEAPEVASAFDSLIGSIVHSKGLDNKMKQLIYIALNAARGERLAVHHHVGMAKDLGAQKQEVVDAILMTLTVSGISGVVSCLPDAVAQFEQ